jgi:D-glycero-D-manno-heptose 1,7-bisphosphate phosphatase
MPDSKRGPSPAGGVPEEEVEEERFAGPDRGRAYARAVFLDRDGVVNEVVWRDGLPASPREEAEFVLREEAVGAVARLRAAGYRVFVVTNQPDIARGRLAAARLDAMHALMRSRVAIDDARVCPHDDADGCECRKPRPGMLRELAGAWAVELAASFVVGDSWRDVAAGRAAGCRTVLLRRSYNEGVEADRVVDSLEEAAGWILAADADQGV